MSKNKKAKAEKPEAEKVEEVKEAPKKESWWKTHGAEVIQIVGGLGSLAMLSIQILMHKDEMDIHYAEMMTYKDPTTGVAYELKRIPTPEERISLAKACRNGTTEDVLVDLGLI